MLRRLGESGAEACLKSSFKYTATIMYSFASRSCFRNRSRFWHCFGGSGAAAVGRSALYFPAFRLEIAIKIASRQGRRTK